MNSPFDRVSRDNTLHIQIAFSYAKGQISKPRGTRSNEASNEQRVCAACNTAKSNV